MVCAIAIAWSVSQTGVFKQELINSGGWPLVVQFLQASLHPEISPEFLRLTLDATFVTLAYAVCGTGLSVLIGTLGGLFASEVWWQSVTPQQFTSVKRKQFVWQQWRNALQLPWLGARSLFAIPRAIHELIWGLFFVNIFGLDPLTAILAIAIPFGAITAKVFADILDETPRQPLQVLLNSGVSPLTAFTYSLIPQAFPNLLSYIFYRFECSIRSAAVLGVIGAGGLGYQILLSLQSLRYGQLWTLFIALFLLNGCVDFWSALLRRRLGLASRLDLNMLKLSRNRLPLYQQDPVAIASGLVVVVLLPFCFWYLKPDFTQLWHPETSERLTAILQQVWPPLFNRTQLLLLLTLAIQTLAMSILAMTAAGIGGILLSFLAAHNFVLPSGLLNPTAHVHPANTWNLILLGSTRCFLLICRAIPAPIWALIWLFVLFPGILPGAIALGLHNLGILGRLMAEVVENLDERPLKALKAQGASGSQLFLYGILPPTLPRFTAYILYRWEVCIRETVIVGLVGAGGLGRLLTEQLSSFDYRGLVTTLMAFVGLTFLVDAISASIRKALR